MKKLLLVAVAAAGLLAVSGSAWADSCDFGNNDRDCRGSRWGVSYSVGYFPSRSHRVWREYRRPHNHTVVVYRQEPRTIVVPVASADTVVINVINDNGSYTPVTLRREGNVYIGPRGEQYLSLPTAEQLKAVYGLK